jgi:hypothetical protein
LHLSSVGAFGILPAPWVLRSVGSHSPAHHSVSTAHPTPEKRNRIDPASQTVKIRPPHPTFPPATAGPGRLAVWLAVRAPYSAAHAARDADARAEGGIKRGQGSGSQPQATAHSQCGRPRRSRSKRQHRKAPFPLGRMPASHIMTMATPTRRCGTSASASASAHAVSLNGRWSASARAVALNGRPTATESETRQLHSRLAPACFSDLCTPTARATFRFRFPFCAPHRTYLLPWAIWTGRGRVGREKGSKLGEKNHTGPCRWVFTSSSCISLTSPPAGHQGGDDFPEAGSRAGRVRMLGRRRAGPPRGVLPAGGDGGR